MAQLRLKDYLVVSGGILLIALSISFAHVNPVGGAGSAPVTVTNTPLPVSVSNFPASNTVSGSVSITGTPNVGVANTASNPVPTQNVGGGAAAQVGQVASQLVNLVCDFGKCRQVFPDGTDGPAPYSVPSGQALVITDFQFTIGASTQGQGNYNFFNVQVNDLGSRVASFSGVEDGQNVVAAERHLTTGLVIPPGSSIVLSALSGDAGAFIQGYLIPNQ
jgi:hypothetical protein